MLILFVVLLGIAASVNTNVTHLVDYDIQPSTDVIFGEDYNLTCIVKDQHTRVAYWLKNGTKLEKQADDTTRENGTLRVTYRIKSFSSMDIGNYSCVLKYRKKGEVWRLSGEVLKLDYRPEQREDPVEKDETEQNATQIKTEQNNTQNETLARPFTTIPETTAFEVRQVCKLIKSYNNWGTVYYGGAVLTIPKDRLLTNDVLTIKARIQHRYDPYYDPYYGPYDRYYDQWDHGYNKRGRRRRNERNMVPTSGRPSSENNTNEKTKSDGDKEQFILKNDNITEDLPTKHKDRKPKTTKLKVLSIEKQNGSNRQHDSIDVDIIKPTSGRAPSTDWSVSGTIIKHFNKVVFQFDKNRDLKLQMVYNSATHSLEIITPHKTRSITVPSDDLRNLTQISIGDDINRQGISIEYISICQPVKPSISLTVEVKNEALNLICTATGPPFLTGYWKMGGGRIYSSRLVTERLNEKDALQTLTLTLTLSPSELQTKEYSCHVSSTSSGDTEVIEAIKLRGDDYRKIIDTNCPECGGDGGGDGDGDGDGADTDGVEQQQPNNNTGNKERSVNIALGSVCGLLFLMLLAQLWLHKIHKSNKKITEEEEGELSTVTKWERQVERYKAFGLYSENFNPDYDEMRRNKQKNKTDAEGEGGDTKEGEGADKTEEKKEDTKKNKGEERELTPSEIQIERYKSLGLYE